MKKHVLGFFVALASVLFMFGCDVGLGEVVDTQAPTLEIVYPPMAATVRDKFILYGTWSDDKGVSSVSVKVVNTETKETVDTVSAVVGSDKTWQAELNEYDSDTGYYKYKDGSYQISVTAYDGAGHSSGESSRTFDIDNTAPVFVISNPGVVKSDNLEASAYGSVFTVEGTIADDHTISLMDVAIYDQSGSLVSHETYDSEQIDFFREEEISTAGGTSVTIAQYADSPSTTANTRYSDVYGTDSSAGTKYYYASVTLTDSAQVYQNPTGSERAVADVKSDALGNSTSTVYLYDDVYTSLMSAKKGLGLSAADLKNVLNGTVSNDSVLSTLNESAKDTSSSEESRLYFSLNPEANPTYTISGYTFGFNDGETVQSASNGNTVNVTINSGLDGVKVDPSTLKLWMYTCDGSGKPTEADVSEKISNLASKVKLLETNASSDGEETITESQIAEIEETGWTLVYDYYAYNGSTVDVKSIAMTLPSSGIVLNKYYILAATGYDADDVPFSQKTIYGFAGNVSGIAPTIEILTPENGAFVSADSLEFTGTALVNNDSLHVSKLQATISAWNGSIAVGDEDGYSVTLTYDATEAKWTSTNSEAFSINGTAWTFTPSKIDGFLDATADATKYTLSIYGESSSGHNITMSSMVQLDTTAPVVSITTVTPTVSGADFDGSDNVYINGTVRIMGSIVEQNLASVTYDIWASPDLTKELTASNSILAQMKTATENNPNIPAAYDGNLETSNSIDVSFMSSMVTQGMIRGGAITKDTPIKIRVVITATDEVGNTGTYSSDEYNDGKDFIIYQETDRPKITFGNADSSVTSESGINSETNLFGTTSNNKLSLSFEDDDSVAKYEVYLYNSDGTTLAAVNDAYGDANPYSLSPNKTTASLNYLLPETEGVYQVKVVACDSGYVGVEATSFTDAFRKIEVGNFYIAVDSGAPTLSVDSINPYLSTTDTISGTISPSTKSFYKGSSITAVFVDSNYTELDSQPATLTAIKNGTAWEFPLSSMPDGVSKSYVLKITVEDKYHQKSSTNVSFSMDPNAPTIDATNFTAQTVKLDESSYVTLKANAEDETGGSGIATFGYYLSTSETAPENYSDVTWNAMNQTNSGWNVTFDISSSLSSLGITSDGTVYAFLAAKDNAGNTTIHLTPATLTIDKTAPAITVTGFDGNAVSANGSATTKDSTKTFSVEVADTNLDSLVSDNSSVTVGTGSVSDDVTTYLVTVSWTDSNGSVEDSKTITFTATDKNNRETKQTVTVKCDNKAPVVAIDSTNQYYTSAPLLSGTISDTNLTGTSSDISVYLVKTTDSSVVKDGAVTVSGTSWNAAFSGVDAGTYGIVIVAADTFGNESAYKTDSVSVPSSVSFSGTATALSATEITIDATAPELSGSVKVGISANPTTTVDSSFYSNGSADIYITGKVADENDGSGIDSDSVWILPYSKVSSETAIAANKATVDSDGNFAFMISHSSITKSGNVYLRVSDKAGNITDTSLFAITYDATKPKIQSYALSDNTSGFTAYNSGKDSSGNAVYYVNNGDGHTFTLSGIATDNLGLSSAVLSINSTKVGEITDEDSLSSYSFGSIDLSSYSGDASAKITLTDKAGNTAEQTFTIKFDTVAPQGIHDTDSANQDYTFRIGSGTGGKYSAGTYGNASTIQIRGYFNETETGSGTNMIYYKLFSGSAPTAADATTFLSNYETSATGYFSPLSSEESAEVSSSVDSTTKTVKTNFKSNIAGFQEGNNYLLLVAVDNVGNAALDNVVYSYTDESGTEVPVTGCYSINVDTTLPSVESDVSSTILTSGNGDITISGTAADSDAGIDSVAVKITVGTETYSSSDTDSKITVTTKTASGDTDNDLHWTATISKDAFSSVSSGNFTVYATATDKAGEGNSQTVSVANISVDKVAPTVTLTKPTTADSSKTDNTYINGTISLSGTIKDANTLPDTAITGIQVSTDNSTWTNISSDSSDSGNIVMDSFSFEGNYTFTVSGFDTTKLDDETEYYIRAVAVDAAGNTGYSAGVEVKVSQDTDRPVVKITNLSVNSGGSYILRYGTDSQITATVTDDDGIDSVVISGSEYTGSESVSEESVYTASTGTVTFTPADTADGTKTFYVYVKDSEGKEFYTTYQTVKSVTDYLNIPKISVANEDIGNDKEAAVFTYVSDSTSPVVGTVEGLAYKSDGTTKNGGYNSETASYTEYETVGASYVVGGTERQKVKFQISASDKNGIAGMTAEISYKDSDGNDVSKKIRTSSLTDDAYSAYTENGSLVVSADDSTSATWTTTDLISLADAATGSITLTVTPYDKSGLVGNGTFTFVADQSGPTVKVTSPSSTEHVSGSSILVSGIATDVGGSSTSTIQWGIPNTSGTIEKWQGELTATSSVSAWSFNFDGSSNASFSEFIDSSKYKVSESDDSIWTIPVYFKATDLLGNETVYEDFSLLYDPDADRPQTTLSYPGEADKKSGEDFAILGGTIRATGSVEIPDGSTSVWAVYMQISDDNGNFDTADKTRAANAKAVSDGVVAPTGYGYEVVDADSMEANWQTANSNTGSLNFHSTDSSKDSSYRSSWWGIKVTKNSGSWYVNLNSSGELNSNVSGSTNNIKVRFCGVSEQGKVGHWTEPYSIHIDSNVPTYTTAMYKYSDDIDSVSDLYKTATSNDSDSGIVTASKIKPYEADMYLKGQWYAFAKITDESSVKITGVKRGTTSLTYGTDYFVYPETAGNDGESSNGSNVHVDSSDTSSSYVAYVWVKIDPSYTTTQTYTITAMDSDGTPNTIYPAFELNTDNTAPSLTALTDNSDTAISMTKLRNSDKGISFKTAATDTGSGFDKLLFYFKRTVTNNSTAATTIELPLPAGSSGAWTTGSEAAYVGSLTETDSDLDEGNELYGVTLSGTSSSDGSTTTFTASSDISSYKFIRKGGVIKLSGIYYVISAVDGNAITVDSAVSGSPTSAFAAAAMVLDHVSTVEEWKWDKGSFKVVGDEDDDGFVEFIKKSGSTWTCEATIMGNQLEDGPISLVTVAFDKAENVTTTTTNVMIANNTPRLAKVFLATDLNGDGKYTDNEFGSSKIKNLNQTYKFYSALTNGTEGSASEVVTLSQSSDEATVGLTMRDSLAAAFEFVSGNSFEGYGSGNGDLYYKLDVGTEKLDKAKAGSVSATDGTKLTKLEAMSDKFASVSDIEIGSTAVSAKSLTGLIITPANITSGTYGTHTECTSSEQTVSYIGLTLWDSTKGTTPGVGDTVSDKKITAFGSQSTVVNIPLYIDLTDDVKPNPTFADPTAHTDGGHVELSSTLPSGTFTENDSDEYDTDTKISGKVVFTGTVSDEKRVSSIKLTSGKAINSSLTSAVEVASYDTTNGLLKVTDAASATDGWTFAITETTADEQFSVTDGHKVTWTLTLDSSYVANVAASDVLFTLTASDGTNGADATYRVDIVPYITGIVRGNTTISGGTMNRSNIGRYPVAEGETLKVSGYNLGTSGSWTVGTNNTTTSYTGTKADDGTYSFSMTVPARSGNLSVKVNSISSLNNDNNDTQTNNQESFKMSGTSTAYSASDNRYLSVWNLGNYFKNTLKSEGKEFEYPVMTAKANGDLVASWGTPSNGSVTFSYGLAKNSTAIYNAYDQPGSYTGVAFDQKGSSGAASVMYMAELQGNGGTYSVTASASDATVGGAVVTQIGKDDIDNAKVYSGKKAVVTGNPSMYLDGDNTTGFYTLQNYDMQRRLGIYKNPQAARYGNYLHNIWYDSQNESLKYSVVNLGEDDITDNYSEHTAAFSGWVLVDGNYTQQDRVFEWTTDTTGSKTNNKVGGAGNKAGTQTGVGSTYNPVVFSKVIFLGSNTNKDHAKTSYIGDTTSTSLVINGASYATAPEVGDSIALLDNTNGGYKILVSKITKVDGTTITWEDSLPDGFTIHSATIYQGNMNVVGGNDARAYGSFTAAANQSSSAGSSAAIDVTTDGYPVVAYYDATNSELRLACASAVNPSLASKWTRVVPGVSCSGEVSLKVDGANNVHIMYNNEDGQMCYLFGKYSSVGSYTWSGEEVVDENGSLSYGSISVIYDGSSYVPAMTYLNKANTANGVKYAARTVAPDATDAASGVWDFMIIPALGNGHYALKENKISLESSNNWTNTTATVLQNQLDTTQPSTATPATVDSVIAYKTSKAYETAYLKKE